MDVQHDICLIKVICCTLQLLCSNKCKFLNTVRLDSHAKDIYQFPQPCFDSMKFWTDKWSQDFTYCTQPFFRDLHFYMMQYATYSSLHILFKLVTGLLSKQSLRILIIYCHITLKGRIILKLTCWLVTCNRTTSWPLPKIEIQQTDSMSMSVTSR